MVSQVEQRGCSEKTFRPGFRRPRKGSCDAEALGFWAVRLGKVRFEIRPGPQVIIDLTVRETCVSYL